MNDAVQESLIDQLRPVLSDGRVGTYLTAAGFDEDRALRLYIWNAIIGEAFHLPIQAAEVGLRNRISDALSQLYGSDWWKQPAFIHLLKGDRERLTDIETATRRIQKRGSPLVTGQVVATLSFGFWVGMLQPRYNIDVWSRQLRSAFHSLPADKNRFDLAASSKRVADLRNRIWHHEPIFRMNLLEEFGAVMELLGWVCPIKAAWIRPQCRVAALMRQKP